MSDRFARIAAGALLVLAALALVLDLPLAIRLPVVIAFSFIAPGLAATRFVPGLGLVDRLAFVVAISLSAVILVSLLLVAVDEWSGTLTFAELACLTTAFVAFPPPRSALAAEPDAVAVPAPGQAFVPEIRVAATSADDSAPDGAVRTLAEIHRRTRSSDPRERRAGLHELAEVLEAQGEVAWAADLRSQADMPEV